MLILRTCKTCGLVAHTVEDLELFTSSPTGKHGRRQHCKKCSSKKTLEWRSNNPERWTKYVETYRSENRGLINRNQRNRYACKKLEGGEEAPGVNAW